MPVFAGLFGRLLDLLTTTLALSNPNNFEANPLYINWIVNIVIGFLGAYYHRWFY
ncbi:MAG: hypothetical protein QG670_2356 [Thermoproteota archaeon]|nr:hypothetical protein [Thermoproteota archaeon]